MNESTRPDGGTQRGGPETYEVYRYSDDLGGDYEAPHLHHTTEDLTEAQALVAVRDRLDHWQFPVAIVQFRDENCEVQAVPEAHLTDVSWSERGREYVVVNRLDRDDVAELLAIADEEGDAHADR